MRVRQVLRLRASTLASDERGVTLVELLVAIVVGFVVIGIPLTLLSDSFVHSNTATSRSATTANARTGLDRLVRELRHATAATISSSGSTATAVLTVPQWASVASATPATTTVTWTCLAGSSCTRREGAGSAVPMIRNVSSVSFAPVSPTGATTVPATNPAFVAISLAVQIASENDPARAQRPLHAVDTVELRDGVDLRNFSS